MKNKKIVLISVLVLLASALLGYSIDFLRSRPKTNTASIIIDGRTTIVIIDEARPLGFGIVKLVDVNGEIYRVKISDIVYVYSYNEKEN